MSSVATGLAIGAYSASEQRGAADRASRAQQVAADKAMRLQNQQYMLNGMNLLLFYLVM